MKMKFTGRLALFAMFALLLAVGSALQLDRKSTRLNSSHT